MKTTTTVLMSLGLATLAHANMILTSDTRSVTAAGNVKGTVPQNYSDSQNPLAPFAPFNGNANGSLATLDNSGFPVSAQSVAVQNSTVSTTQISWNGRVSATSSSSFGDPTAGGSSFARTVLQITFSIPVATTFTFNSDPIAGNWGGQPNSNFDFYLTSVQYGIVITGLNPFLGIPASGSLGAGDYTLRFEAYAQALLDPLGSGLGYVNYNMNFNVAPTTVPEAMPTAIGLGAVLIGLIGLRRRFFRNKTHPKKC